ncbi:Aste57867_21365 [Aphanomyces stellatus]|uniref:Aste57867_21365 protein n=1 Tax=Aphanomyces stellatus TaxID=120398 RepID=A0A485LI05_9STRA|nr:hypothetical protein As57867_021296 [Aphanomyces stellatus]VFT98037.1 Aste57867_21365 [Aphanomyces stellatus]
MASQHQIHRGLLNADLFRAITSYQPGVCRLIRYIRGRWKRQTGPYAKAHFVVEMLPRDAAVDRLYLLQQLHAACPRVLSRTLMDLLAKAGYLDVVMYMHEQYSHGCTRNALNLAAANGHLDVVVFLDTHRTEGGSSDAMDLAAAGGHLHVLRYLHAHRLRDGCTENALCLAAANGHVDVVAFLLSHCQDVMQRHAIQQPRRRVSRATKHPPELPQNSSYRHEWLAQHHDRHERRRKPSQTIAIDEEDDGLMDVAKDDCVEFNAMDWAIIHGHLDVAVYLHRHWNLRCSSAAVVHLASLRGHDMGLFMMQRVLDIY